jgi:thiamine-phosphate pyrophosphorylase
VAVTSDGSTIADRRREWLRRARLYLVCEARPGDREPEELLRPALQAGVDVVQLREKHADDGDIVRAGRAFRRLCDAYDALFIVNDRPELAMACAADGVHVGQDDLPPGEVRRMVGEDALIGLSTHSAEQVDAVSAVAVPGVDYFCVGPVYATPTKPDYEPVGLDLVRYASGQATVPCFAIGGIDPGNVGEVVRAGAERVVVVRAIRDADDPGVATRALRQGIDAALHAGARG